MDEQTAYHEAGHVVMALIEGGRIVQASIEPNDDDGPNRYGETVTQWPPMNARDVAQTELAISVAGPVAETIWQDEYPDSWEEWAVLFDETPEWMGDWIRAIECGKKMAQLENRARSLSPRQCVAQSAKQTFDVFQRTNTWASIAGIADLLLAFETIEHEQCMETVGFWLRNA